MSAIDWLTEGLALPQLQDDPGFAGRIGGLHGGLDPEAYPPLVVGEGVEIEAIAVAPLDGATADGAGLLGAAAAGVPRDLWGDTPARELAAAFSRIDPATLPALQALALRLLLAEVAPPPGAGGQLVLARIDRLIAFGALDQALALAELVGPDSPALFARWFDIALLTGTEEAACARLRVRPDLSPGYAAQVFCLARGGDWSAAALTLRTAEVLGMMPPAEVALLARFIDPELAEDEALPDLPARPSPLVWRLWDALGEPLPTAGLPVAFAHADLGSSAGWRARIDAAERLARYGVLEPNRLLGLYTEGRPAASGGVWDRVASVQRLETALASGDADQIGLALIDAWTRMNEAELEVVFAGMVAPRLTGLTLDEAAARVALKIGLLGPDPAAVARAWLASAGAPRDQAEAAALFYAGIALGRADLGRPPGAVGAAVAEAFAAPARVVLPADPAPRLNPGALAGGLPVAAPGLAVQPVAAPRPDPDATHPASGQGAAVLAAIADLTAGAQGELRLVVEGLVALRAAGFEEDARAAALQLLLSDRRG